MAIRVMLVEDEAGIRLILRKIIEKHEEFEIVAECEELADAVIQFLRQKPEVVFLDIGIKGQNGVECARILTDLDPKVKIIFATAHAEYMSDAFELYAFDYLVKPFSIDRVNRTLNRIAEMGNPKKTEADEKIVKSEYRCDKLLVKGKESMSFVDIPEKVGRVRFSRRFLRLKQIHAQRCLKIGITTETELLAKADDRSR